MRAKSRFPEAYGHLSDEENVDTHVNANSIHISFKIFTVQTLELFVRIGTSR
jgi:hypothetical protein